jgi:uncharacterized protein YjbI with pentapeptide repeats
MTLTPRWILGLAITVKCLFLAGGFGLAFADHPAQPLTIELGPGNEEASQRMRAQVGRMSFSELQTKGLTGVSLAGRDLRRARIHLSLAAIRDGDFAGADLSGADIAETSFENCSFRGARLRGLYTQCEVKENCDVTDADISGSFVRLSASQLRSTKNYRARDLSNTILSGDFGSLNFAAFDLRGAVFFDCRLEGCDFTDADIARATFYGSDGGAERTKCFRRILDKEQLYSTKSYKEKSLDQVLFSNVDLTGFDFSGQCLGQFRRCDLTDARFDDAEFPQPLNAHFLPSRMPTAGIGFLRKTPSNYGVADCNMTAEQFYSTRTHKSKRLPEGFVLEQMDLTRWDFSGMDLRYVSFRDSSLAEANLENARGGLFEFARDVTVAQIRSTWSYRTGKLHTVDFVVPREPGLTLPKSISEALEQE